MYTTIKPEISKILTDSNLFEAVFDYEPLSLGAFPAVCVTADSHSANDSAMSFGSPMQDRTYVFKIRLYYGLTQSTESADNDKQKEAERTICDLADKVIDLFAINRNLNQSCEWVMPVDSKIGETEREMIVKYCEITLEAHSFTR